MRGSGLKGFPVLHHRLDSQGIQCPGKTFRFTLMPHNHRHSHPFFGKLSIYTNHFLSFLNGFLFRRVSRVSFLPQEFSSTQKHTRTHLPTHHVSPLVTEDRKITIRLNPVFISIPNNRFRSRTNNIFLLQFGSRIHNYPTSIRIIF